MVTRYNPKYSTKELTAFQSKLQNIDSCKSHLKNSAIYNSKEIYNKNKDFTDEYGTIYKSIIGDDELTPSKALMKLIKVS